ncbi:MAG: hypothetical protein O2819_00900 [Planctomycetota bacterium]|nr:hypothetical protein [Planctomycetota bacterium]MDA1105660.1 hypothetical protein [Planctomycetota bacterium]
MRFPTVQPALVTLAMAIPTVPVTAQEGAIITASGRSASQPGEAVPPPIVLANPIVVDGPLPTLAPAWGNQVAWSGSDFIVMGTESVRQPGFDGQVMTVVSGDGRAWAPLHEYAALANIRQGSVMFQHTGADGGWLATNVQKPDQTGEVLLLRRDEIPSGWSLFARLSSPAGQADPLFGSAIAFRGGTLAIGTTDNAIRNGPRRLVDSPRVHLFRVTNGEWKAEGYLEPPPDSTKSIWFGASVATTGDWVFVSSPQSYTPSPKQELEIGGMVSCVYAFQRTVDAQGKVDWVLRTTLFQPDGASHNAFGMSIVAGGDLLVVRSTTVKAGQVGAQRDSATSLFVFRLRGMDGARDWVADGTLQPGPGVQPGLGIGFAMDVGDGMVAVGDPSADLGTGTLGTVYVFGKIDAQWREVYRLVPSVPCATGRFGVALAMQGRIVGVGRIRSERDNIEPGGAYLYQLP